MAQTHLPPQWDKRLLAILNSHGWDIGQFAPEALRLLAAWAQAEGGSAEWDPLNSELHVFSGTVPWQGPDYNSAGVADYLKPTYGVMATAATLLNGNYNGIVGFLQSPQITAEEAVDKYRSQFQTWGTNPQTILDCLGSV